MPRSKPDRFGKTVPVEAFPFGCGRFVVTDRRQHILSGATQKFRGWTMRATRRSPCYPAVTEGNGYGIFAPAG